MKFHKWICMKVSSLMNINKYIKNSDINSYEIAMSLIYKLMDYNYLLKKAREVDLLINLTLNKSQKDCLDIIRLYKFSDDLENESKLDYNKKDKIIEYFKDRNNQLNNIDKKLLELLDTENQNEIFSISNK